MPPDCATSFYNKLLFCAVYGQIWAEEEIQLSHFRLCAYITFLTTTELFHFLMQMFYAADQWYVLLPCFSKKKRYGMVLSVSAHMITFNPKDNFIYVSTCLKDSESTWKAGKQRGSRGMERSCPTGSQHRPLLHPHLYNSAETCRGKYRSQKSKSVGKQASLDLLPTEQLKLLRGNHHAAVKGINQKGMQSFLKTLILTAVEI